MAEKMNPQIRDQWVAALRSGEYAQGQGTLRRGDKFCCLGVLCDLAEKAGIAKSEDHYGERTYWTDTGADENSGELPAGIAEWSGLQCENPKVTATGLVAEVYLSELNDDEGMRFAQIADLIEGQL